MIGVVDQLRIITVPLSGPAGCLVNPMDCCPEGSGGSGCGSGCTEDCPTCILATRQWSLVVGGSDPITLCYVEPENVQDGNSCRWDSSDLTWSLYYDSDSLTWFLVNYQTGDVWFLSGLLFDCADSNDLTSADGLGAATVSPTEVCGGIDTGCCPNPVPARLGLTFSVKGGCEFSGASVSLVYDSGADKWIALTGATYTCFDQIQLVCSLGLWGLTFYKGLSPVSFTCLEGGCMGAVDCGPPFTFTFSWIGMGGCAACGNMSLTVTG